MEAEAVRKQKFKSYKTTKVATTVWREDLRISKVKKSSSQECSDLTG